MNSCILMAEIIKEPELRYTPDNQNQIAQLLVEFPGSRPEEPRATLKVVGWGKLAEEIHASYHQGDRVIIEGRLSMNTIDRPEGFKEKRAELTASRIYKLGADADFGMAATASTAEEINKVVVPFEPRKPATVVSRKADVESHYEYEPASASQETFPTQTPDASSSSGGRDLDDIPF
jgi:single-strand DNA-binding protein